MNVFTGWPTAVSYTHLYLNTGQTALAKEDFQYVTEHSEDTSLVSDSKDVLKTL